MKQSIERIAAACALILMIASFFTGLYVIAGLGYEVVIGQAAAFCR